jgi:hypothetical protein
MLSHWLCSGCHGDGLFKFAFRIQSEFSGNLSREQNKAPKFTKHQSTHLCTVLVPTVMRLGHSYQEFWPWPLSHFQRPVVNGLVSAQPSRSHLSSAS